MLGMKKNSFIATIIVAFAICIGCTSQEPMEELVHISFSINQATETRVSYSGEWEGTLERIDWKEGDVIRVFQEDHRVDGVVTSEAKYIITSVTTAEGYRSEAQAQIAPGYEPFKYKDGSSYIYKGYYPGDIDDVLDNDGTYHFTVPSTQDSDVSKGLFMIVSNFSGNTQNVKLEFKPVVNTYKFTFPAENDISSIQLESLSEFLSGDFSTVDGKNFEATGNNGRTVVCDKLSNSVTLFAIPKKFDQGQFYLRINDMKLYGLQTPYSGVCYKYNFEFPTISTKPGSLFFATVLAYARANLDYAGNWQWDFDKGEIVGPRPAPIYWGTIPEEELWDIIKDVEVIDVTIGGEGWFNEITPEDLNVFPKLREVTFKNINTVKNIHINNPNITKLYLDGSSLQTINIEGCHGLETFYIENTSKSGIYDVIVKDNLKLKDFTVKGPTGDHLNVTCWDCPELTTFTIACDDTYGTTYHLDLQRCPKFIKETVPSWMMKK